MEGMGVGVGVGVDVGVNREGVEWTQALLAST